MKKTGTLLDPILRQLGIESGVRLEQMKSEWHVLFNKPLSLHMSPWRLSGGELTLFVDSPVWMQQLNYCRQEIIGKLGRYGVKEVRFRIGRISPPRQPADSQSAPVLSREEREFVEGLAHDTGDRELGRAVRAAAERSLLAKKKSGR
jgi:hypothetical protein